MYVFCLVYDDDVNNPLYFPLTTDSFKTAVKSLNTTVETVTGKQMTILKGLPLREFSLNVLFPKDKNLVDYDFLWVEPIKSLSKLRDIRAKAKEIRFILLRPQQDGTELFEGNLLVTLEDYSVDENAGEEGDFYVTIKLKEYEQIQSKVVVTTNQKNEEGQTIAKEVTTRTTKEPAKTYTVEKGDTLWQIAKKELGDGSKYTEIATKNNISDPNKLQVGQVLTL